MPLQACIPDTTPSTGISLLRCPYFCALRAISSPSVELERRGHWRRRTSQTRQLVTVDFLPDSLSTYLCRTRSRATIVDSSHDNHSFLRWEQTRTERTREEKQSFRTTWKRSGSSSLSFQRYGSPRIRGCNASLLLR